VNLLQRLALRMAWELMGCSVGNAAVDVVRLASAFRRFKSRRKAISRRVASTRSLHQNRVMPATATPSSSSLLPSSDSTAPAPAPLCFGDFVLDIGNARLTRGARAIELTPKSFALLSLLAQRPGDLVLKDTLLDEVWGRRFVSEGAVKTVVSELRAALGDDARAPRWVQTVQGRGYRFLGAVGPAPQAAKAKVDADARWRRGGNLPATLPPVIGREDDLQALDALTRSHRLVTLVGTAGVGKTFLALTLAVQQASNPTSVQADGCWLIELAPLDVHGTTPSTLCGHLAHTLNLAEAAGRDPDALSQAVAGLSLMLVVDNAEHLLGALAPLLSRLLSRAPGLRCLVTSREPLQLPGEQVYRLGPLAVPAPGDEAEVTRLMACGALRLFVDRVAARLPGFVLTTSQQAPAAQLCRALDGLPLALELAAARVPTLGLEGLAGQLAREGHGDTAPRLQLLTRGTRTAAPHQRTLRATLDWSHDLLTDTQQRVFRRLAVFRGGFTMETAQQVCADPSLDEWAVLDAVDALVEKSMVLAPDVRSVERRFGLLQSLQDYAQERLVEAGEAPALRERHLLAVMRYWQCADARALGDPALAWVTRHGVEIDNLRAALAHAFARLQAGADEKPSASSRTAALQLLCTLVGHTGLLWHRAGHAVEGLGWCRAALDAAGLQADTPSAADTVDRAGIDLAMAHLAGIGMVLSASEGLAAARRAVAAYARAGDRVRETYALYLQHTLMCRAEPQVDRSACIARMDGLLPHGASDLLLRFGRSARAYEARLAGDFDTYLRFNQQELARCREAGAVWESWSAAIGLMLAEHDCGHTDQAIAVGRDVLAEIRAAGRLRQNANRLGIWTMMLAQSGDTAGTREAMPEALDILTSAGRRGMVLLPLAWLAAHEGRHDTAVLLLARFDAPQRTGSEFAPGTYIRRSMDLLWARLQESMDAEALARLRSEAAAATDDAVIERALSAARRA